MTTPRQGQGWAIVTGASSGIGREFAKALAARGHSLLVVARRRDRLDELARDLASTGVQVEPFVADLESREGPAAVANKALELGQLALLINCAGFGNFGYFSEQPLDKILGAVRLNIESVVELTHRLLPVMKRQKSGGVINVGSSLGLQPVPYFSVYAATKAFVISFSEGLAEELSGTGVQVVVVCPGPVKTEFADHSSSGSVTSRIPNLVPEDVVRAALAAYDGKRVVTIPGFTNKLLALCPRLLPRSAMRGTMAMMMKPAA
ncbi:MAG TPA: SDR family oxidoreductase [Bryobacteraceae bacterium]|jgi:short-subunit dehydrogenase|nr:SDR family oxidoreductase [Bryobacteraceae bacterium]